MAMGLRLLKLVAKVAIDKVLGRHGDEAVELFQTWWSGTDAATREQELAEAKRLSLLTRAVEGMGLEQGASGETAR